LIRVIRGLNSGLCDLHLQFEDITISHSPPSRSFALVISPTYVLIGVWNAR
jgi:hypothetical protein